MVGIFHDSNLLNAMKKIVFGVLPFLLCCLFSCDSKEPIQLPEIFQISGEIRVPLDSSTTFACRNIQYVEKENLLITLPTYSNWLHIYDLNQEKEIQKVPLYVKGPNDVGGAVDAFYFHTVDSIFVLAEYTNKVCLVNSSGVVKDSFRIQPDYEETLPLFVGGAFSSLKYIDGCLYMSGFLPKLKPEASDKFQNALLKYEIQTGNYSYLMDNPDKVNDGNWLMRSVLCYDYIQSSKSFIGSFSVSDSLYLSENGKTNCLGEASSVYIDSDDIEPYNFQYGDSPSDYMERAKYSFGLPIYWGVKYDPYRELCYRFGVINKSMEAFEAGEVAEKTIIVLDKDFSMVGEQKMSALKYDYEMSFVHPKGLCIANQDKYNHDYGYLTFDIFSLK